MVGRHKMACHRPDDQDLPKRFQLPYDKITIHFGDPETHDPRRLSGFQSMQFNIEGQQTKRPTLVFPEGFGEALYNRPSYGEASGDQSAEVCCPIGGDPG